MSFVSRTRVKLPRTKRIISSFKNPCWVPKLIAAAVELCTLSLTDAVPSSIDLAEILTEPAECSSLSEQIEGLIRRVRVDGVRALTAALLVCVGFAKRWLEVELELTCRVGLWVP